MRKDATGVTGTGSSRTIRRRELGARLRALRADKGITLEQVATRLMCTPSKVSRMEGGHRSVSPRDLHDLIELYEVADPAEREHLLALAEEGRARTWWGQYGLPYDEYIGYESAAVAIRDFESGVVPGLLRTSDYARALHEAIVPPLSPEEITQRVEVRMLRQRVLARPDPPQFTAIMDEAVLRRVVGGPTVMRDQLKRLTEAVSLPNVSIRVLPYDAGAHAALDSTFIMLEFPAVPGVIYVDGLVGQIYLEREQDVQRYRQVFDQLCALSLGAEGSADLISAALRTYRDQ